MKFCYFLQLFFLINVGVTLSSLPSEESSDRRWGWKGVVSGCVDNSSHIELIEPMLNALYSTFIHLS